MNSMPSPSVGVAAAAKSADIVAAELVSTRLCHDLAGLASAFSNGAEIITQNIDDKQLVQSSAELLTMSAEDARARICLFRKLFGSDQQDQETPDDIVHMAQDYLRGFTITSENGNAMIGAVQAKILLAFAMIALKAFPVKADIHVTFDGSGFSVKAQGRMLAIEDIERTTLLCADVPDIPAYANLASWRLRHLAEQAGVDVSASFAEKSITLVVAAT